MKKLLIFVLLFISLKSFAQYPIPQSLGSDSTLVTSRGGMKSRFINKPYTDTTQANLERIKFYDGAQIYTKSGGGRLWIRDSTLNKWVAAGGTLQQVFDLESATAVVNKLNTISLSGNNFVFHGTRDITVLSNGNLKIGSAGRISSNGTDTIKFTQSASDVIGSNIAAGKYIFYTNGTSDLNNVYLYSTQGDFLTIHSPSQVNFEAPFITSTMQNTSWLMGAKAPLVFNGSGNGSTPDLIEIYNADTSNLNNNGGISFTLNRTAFVKMKIARIAGIITDTAFHSPDGDLQFYTTKDSVMAENMRLKGNGQLQLNKYGVGTFTGTPTKPLFADASGNVVEAALGFGSLRFGVAGEDTRATADRSFSMANNKLLLDSLDSRFVSHPKTLSTRRIRLSSTDGTDSSTLSVEGGLTGTIRSVQINTNTTSTGTYNSMQIRDGGGTATQIFVTGNGINESLITLDTNKVSFARRTALGVYGAILEVHDKYQDQWGDDSVVWRVTDRTGRSIISKNNVALYAGQNEIELNNPTGVTIEPYKQNLYIDSLQHTGTATAKMMTWDSTSGRVETRALPSGTGTVTSVGFTGGLISVATPTTTPAFTVAGTSGGIPYFSSSSTWASSAALASTSLVIGGGAGATPTTSANLTFSTGLGVGLAGSAAFAIGIGGSGYTSGGFGMVGVSISPAANSSPSLMNVAGTIVEAGSGTHTFLASLNIDAPTVTAGAATVTNTASLRIASAPVATVTGGNYSLWVDAGTTRLDDNVLIGQTTDNGTQLQTTSFSAGYVAKTGTYTATATDHTIDCTSGTFSLNLPTSSGITGRVYTIKNSGAGTITIDPAGSETIDAVTTKTLSVQYSGMTIQSNGANWIIIATF